LALQIGIGIGVVEKRNFLSSRSYCEEVVEYEESSSEVEGVASEP